MYGNILVNNEEALKKLDETNTKAESTSKVFSTIGKVAGTIGATVATAAVALGTVAIKEGSAFESAVTKASTLFGDVEVDYENLNAKLVELSNKTGVTATDLGNTLYDALSAGIPASEDMSEALSFLEKSTMLSKAGFTDINTAMTATAKTLNAYGLEVTEADRIQKIMMQTQNNGIVTVGELGQVLAQVTPTAAAMGVSFEQVGAALSNMTAQGTPAARATTQLNGLFAELGKQGTVAQLAFEEASKGTEYAGKSFTELMKEGVPLSNVLDVLGDYAEENGMALLDMFGSIDAGKAALALSGENAEKFTKNLISMSTEADVVGDAFDTVTGTTAETWGRFMNNLKNMAVTLFDSLQPLLMVVMDLIQQLMPTIQSLIDKFGPIIASLIEKLLPALMILLDALMPVLEPILDLFLMIVDEALMPLIDLLVPIISSIMPILAVLLKELIPILKPILELIFELADEILPLVMVVFEALLPVIEPILKAISALVSAVMAIIKGDWESAWNSVKDVFTNVWEGIKAYLSAWWDITKAIFQKMWEGMKGFFTTMWNSIKDIFEKVFDGIVKGVKNQIENIKDIFKSIIDFVKNVFTGNWKSAWDNVKDIFSSIWEGIKTAFSAPINWIIRGINKFIEGINKIKIPDWVPLVGGKGFSLSMIPELETGGNITESGMAMVGESGPEILKLPKNAQVTPLTDTGSNKDDYTIVNYTVLDGKVVSKTTSKLQAQSNLDRFRALGVPAY